MKITMKIKSTSKYVLLLFLQIKTFDIPSAYHFQPLQSQTLFTVIYPKGQTEEQLGLYAKLYSLYSQAIVYKRN